MKFKNLPWIPFAALAIAVGLYPLIYYVVDMQHNGLLQGKPRELVSDPVWHTLFYIHITFGGIALLTGWPQFSTRLRAKYLKGHRFTGKIYVGSVMLSSLAGLYIAFFATGGILAASGFGVLAVLWFFTVWMAYTSILRKKIKSHENWMIVNYALTFAAVTLRVYLPVSQAVLHLDFLASYRAIAWLCWVPNLLMAGFIVQKRGSYQLVSKT
jgi:hypothetical protein